MVTNITSLTGNGLRDWLWQRISALYLAAYFITTFLYLFFHHRDYTLLHTLFRTPWVQIATTIAIFMIIIHAWIGIWTVTTDYLKQLCLRLSVQIVVMLFLVSELIWGLMIVWGQ